MKSIEDKWESQLSLNKSPMMLGYDILTPAMAVNNNSRPYVVTINYDTAASKVYNEMTRRKTD